FGWTETGQLVPAVLDIVSTTTKADPASVTNTLVLSPTGYTTLNISGNVALDLSPDWEVALMSVKTVAAAGFDAGLHVYLYGNTNDLDIAVGDGADVVVAGFGNDSIATGGGDDIIFAGRAADVVDAGAGNDWIRGGPARDVMTGGTGADTFAYVFAYESSIDTGVDVITDFTAGAGGDVLDFHDLTHGAASFAGNAANYGAVQAALAAGSVRAVMDTSTGNLYLDVDASGTLDGTHDIAIQLIGAGTGLVAANFLF
ncbi:MAG TPA: type I secretion C-terminal target domain-containing protein, partial [Ramlibacter sp.]|nr:type I secretion C-terminal target domain-containing protein [Ramlibacter sp.]